MSTFLDTSALLALVDEEDARHPTATQAWGNLRQSEEALVTSNYVIVEALAVCQRRFGLEAIRSLARDFLPALEVLWVDEEVHGRGMGVLLIANQRRLSLIDCTSFVLMRRLGIRRAFTLDEHFREQGFEVVL